MQITPPEIQPEAKVNYRVKISGIATVCGFRSLGQAARYARKLLFAGQSQENIYIDEYYGSFATGVWYRYDNATLSLIKNSQ
jgi:hypothetical protein